MKLLKIHQFLKNFTSKDTYWKWKDGKRFHISRAWWYKSVFSIIWESGNEVSQIWVPHEHVTKILLVRKRERMSERERQRDWDRDGETEAEKQRYRQRKTEIKRRQRGQSHRGQRQRQIQRQRDWVALYWYNLVGRPWVQFFVQEKWNK